MRLQRFWCRLLGHEWEETIWRRQCVHCRLTTGWIVVRQNPRSPVFDYRVWLDNEYPPE